MHIESIQEKLDFYEGQESELEKVKEWFEWEKERMDELLTLWESEILTLKDKLLSIERTIHAKDDEIKRLKIKHIENEVELGKLW